MTSIAICWSSYQVSALHRSMSANVQIWDTCRVYVMPVILSASRQPAENREGNASIAAETLCSFIVPSFALPKAVPASE
jgi:hypothetical protein